MLGLSRPTMAWQWSGHPERVEPALVTAPMTAAGCCSMEDRERVRHASPSTAPQALNAFNDDLYDAVRDALLDAGHERSDVAVVVITGAGRAFSAGQDLGELAKPRRPTRTAKRHGFIALHRNHRILSQAARWPPSTGSAWASASRCCSHCDLVLMARRARGCGRPFVRLGLTAEAGSTHHACPRPSARQRRGAPALYRVLARGGARRRGRAWRGATVPGRAPARRSPGAGRRDRGHADRVAGHGTKQLLLAKRAWTPCARPGTARTRDLRRRWPVVPANREAIAAFRERRDPDFTKLPDA